MKPLVAIESRLISLLLAAACLALGSCSATGEGPSANPTSMSFPAGSTIRMQLHTGTVKVDAELLAGEMDLRVASPERYRSVRAAVTVGEISARPWQIDLDGLWRSFKATGEGEYQLRAQLLAGQITIRSDQTQDPQPGNIDRSTRSRSTM